MKISAQQYAQALYDSVSEARPADEDRILDNLVKVLADNGHLGMLAEIEDEFRKIDSKARKETPVTVTYAGDSRQAGRNALDELHRVLGKNLALKKNIDSGILGGVVIETEDERIDASVKKQLDDLKDSLTS